jgi:hypothetical protein
VRSADTLEEVLGLVDLLIIGTVSRQALIDGLDKLDRLAEAVDISVGLAFRVEEPSVQALRKDWGTVGGGDRNGRSGGGGNWRLTWTGLHICAAGSGADSSGRGDWGWWGDNRCGADKGSG